MNDLHRHDTFSRFDGFGKPLELAKLAKSLGHTALSTSNHGNTNGLVQTYKACKEVGIKAILGVEGYFLPAYKEQERGYHLCLFAKNLEGYKNLNTLQYEGEKQKYYNPIWDFKMLEKYSEGLICTSACIASYSSQCIVKGDTYMATKYLKKMASIFGDDFYIEIQPYKVSEEGLQEKINVGLIELANELNIKCVLTSDSHRGAEDDFDSYYKMHEMDGHDSSWIEGTYKERYMPTEKEIKKRFYQMHKGDFGVDDAKCMAIEMIDHLEEIEGKVEENILDGLQIQLPSIGDGDSYKQIVKQIKEGLRKRNQYTDEYLQRCKEELDVIKVNGFVDYFLIVADYVVWAKERGIMVGPGRGSVCNCLVAYALHITDVDSIRFNLDFRRFMRYDKKAFPDIDIDFETSRRGEVIDYLINKYDGHAARVASYGLYQVDNTINDLAKVCGLPTDKLTDREEVKENKEVIARIKKIINGYRNEDGAINEDGLFYGSHQREVGQINKKYEDIINHFIKMYGKVKYIGGHAAGVVITSGDILQYTAIRIDKDGGLHAVYSLEDLNDINIIKFDMLGLKTMQSIGECRKLEDVEGFDIKHVDDKKLLEQFRLGNTSGIFQVENKTPRRMLEEMRCDSFADVVATSALNRPGSLSQGMPEQYANNKLNGNDQEDALSEYLGETYGAILYQEQLMLICVNVGGMDWNEADSIIKLSKHGVEDAVVQLEAYNTKNGYDIKKKLITNVMKNGLSKEKAIGLWDSLMVYSFNKGHAVGYSIITMEEMYHKVYYPDYFWYSKIKYAGNDKDKEAFCTEAVKSDIAVFLSHVNYSQVFTSLRKVDGENVLQKGLVDVKDVGEKAAQVIVDERAANGIFRSMDDFIDRCKGRVCNKKAIDALAGQAALDFNKKQYIQKVTTYNASLYARASRS